MEQIRKNLFKIFSVFLLLHMVGIAKCPEGDLGDFLFDSDPKIKSYLMGLSDFNIGKQIDGVFLCDSSNVLRNLIYNEKLISRANGWNIFIFNRATKVVSKTYYSKFAVVWVDSGGQPLPIPTDCKERFKGECDNEAAHVLSFDVYTWADVQPMHNVVMLEYPNISWISKIKQICETNDFPTIDYSLLPSKKAKMVFQQCSRITPKYDSLFVPSKSDIDIVLKQLISLKPNYLMKLSQPVNKYRFQIVGYIFNGERFIYLNCFSKDEKEFEATWRNEVVIVCDGGAWFWGIAIKINTKEVVSFETNGDG